MKRRIHPYEGECREKGREKMRWGEVFAGWMDFAAFT
jgi:hypothetical protein